MFDVQINIDDAIKDLTLLQREQIPFASALAANNLARMGRKAVQLSLSKNFTIAPDRRRFLESTIRFDRPMWATPANPAARVAINQGESASADSPGQKDRSYLLGRHEEGGVKTASDPMKPFYLPTKALRPGAFDVPPRYLYPTSLRIFDRRTASGVLPGKSRKTARGKVQRIGNRRTFVIDARQTSDPRAWGIWQRTGPKRDDIRLLWAWRTSITLKPRLHFYDTFEQVIEEHGDEVFSAALERALRSAR